MDNVIEKLQNARQLVPKKLLTSRDDLSSVEYVSSVFLKSLNNTVYYFSMKLDFFVSRIWNSDSLPKEVSRKKRGLKPNTPFGNPFPTSK